MNSHNSYNPTECSARELQVLTDSGIDMVQGMCIGRSALIVSWIALWLLGLVVPCRAHSGDSLPVKIELFEGMGSKRKVTPRATRDAKTAADDGDLADGNDDTVPEAYQGVRAVTNDQAPDRVYRAPAFGLHRLPFKYDETGVRLLPKGPIVLRASATLSLTQGKHRFVIRTREDASLIVDGKLLGKVNVIALPSDGHNPVRELPNLMVPSLKEFAPGNTELVVSFSADGNPHTFTLETVIGRSGRRPDLGVLAVAVAGPGEDNFRLLGGSRDYQFSDEGWEEYVTELDAYYAELNAQERAEQSARETEYWRRRHDFAKSFIEERNQLEPPAVGDSIPVNNGIDQFVGRQIETAALQHVARHENEQASRPAGRVLFNTDILPILKANCLKCHGHQEKGSLKLDSRSGVLAGGESGEPAVVPGHPERSSLIEMVTAREMPPKGRKLDKQEIELLTRWIQQGADWEQEQSQTIASTHHPTLEELRAAELTPLPKTDDLSFLRRVTLDTVGVIPTEEEVREFRTDNDPERRSRTIDRLLDDPRWADHWVPFWQDILAENPNIVKPNLNNTGAFRWWIYESFYDNKPMDQFVTDLVRMRGDGYIGPAGFGIATQNDAPMAAKAHILGAAFMGIQMKCARCHDAPYQSVRQEDLFNLAAMLTRTSVKVPTSSIVPEAKLSGPASRVQVTLDPNQSIDPQWPFEELVEQPLPTALIRDPSDSREALAACMTSPRNPRFAKTIVNWLWKRYFGKGLVEPAIDWENAHVTHPDLLGYLAQELIRNGYDLKHISRMILNSQTYQRGVLATGNPQAASLFVGHTRRRMTAEQIVDSLHLATGRTIDCEELNMDQDGRRPIKQFINLGKPNRAWEFTSLSNERDRPSLTLPHAQVYVDVLEAYGWNGSRQNPVYHRDHETNILQPAVMSNGIMTQRLTRLTDDHPLTQLAMAAGDLDSLIETLFLKTLGRPPTQPEHRAFADLLEEGFESRVIPESERAPAPQRKRYPYVTWSNHLRSRANEIKDSIARDIELGEPPTRYLNCKWRENFEDGIWALLNSPEMVFIP